MREYLNADIGEGRGLDNKIAPYVGSVNISCGSHAGEESDIRSAIVLALQHDLKIGAHPSYPDKESFGRIELDMSDEELCDSLHNQLNYFQSIVNEMEGEVSYIKPHGGLYNKMAKDYHFACEVIEIFNDWRPVPVVLLASSEATKAADDLGLPYITEGFLDRAYTDDMYLVPRSEEGSVLTDISAARAQAKALISGEPFPSASGKSLLLKVQTVCIHGDTEHALELLEKL